MKRSSALANDLITAYASMWPRDIFYRLVRDGSGKNRILARTLDILKRPGVYVLYRDDVPYYIGKAGSSSGLFRRLRSHAYKPEDRYYNFWNFFSVFVIDDEDLRDEIEGLLIAAMPTANAAEPRIKKEALPPKVRQLIHDIRRAHANPASHRSEKNTGNRPTR